MSQEDQLAQSYAERGKEFDDTTSHFEVHYNDYGNRGVVDYVKEGETHIRIDEIKSESAVRQATGANEILRQYNRHRDAFFDGSDFDRRDYITHGLGIANIVYRLVFTWTEYNQKHVAENAEMYRSVVRESNDEKSLVCFAHPDCKQPVFPFFDYAKETTNAILEVSDVDCVIDLPL